MRRHHLSSALLLAYVMGGACSPAAQQRAAGGNGGSGGTTPDEGTGGSTAGSGGKGGASGGKGGSSGGSGGSGGSLGGSGGQVDASGGSAGGGEDAGGTPDVAGSAGDTNPGIGEPLPPGTRKVVILHAVNAGGSASDPSRKSMMDILVSMKDSHGIVVEWMDSPTKAEALMDKALVIVGPNASMFGANHPDPGLKTLPVPLIVSKDGNTTEIGIGRVSATDPPNFNRITIVKTDHPLAAGFPMGNVVVLTTPDRQRIITFSDLGPGAIKIATGPQSATSWSIIGYDKDADMGNGVKAPAKRVGFFWHRPAGTTAEGTKLFKAAVDWALRP